MACRSGIQETVADADFREAQRFLNLLDEEAETFCFQTFDDSPAKRSELARTLFGSLEELWPTLAELHQRGAGVFVAVNAIEPDKPRRNEHVTGIRAVFADFDSDVWQGGQYPLSPLIEVESSPGKRHVYWPVTGLPVDQFRPVQKAIAKALDADASVCDPCRVMRLPGTLHQKDPDRPHLVRIVHWEPAQPYTAVRVLEAFSVLASALPTSGPAPGDKPSRANDAHLSQARKIAFDAARRTHDDPHASRHAEIVRMAHFLRRDAIPLTERVGELVLETFEAHMRPTDASGKETSMDRASATKALREAYNRPSEPDRPRPGGQRQQAPVPAISASEPWPDPGEITYTPGSATFPIGVFPEVARNAILEYEAYGKQPLPMLADACLAQMALATQGLTDVGRDERLISPLSLNVLIEGESGERKTAGDGAFTGAAKAWVEEETARREPEQRKADAM